MDATSFARVIDAIPLVPNATTRDALLPNPAIGQRVENEALGFVQKWNGTQWTSQGVTRAAGSLVSVTAVGAVGDGANDDGPSFQKAYDAVVANGGGVVEIPASLAGYRIATTINVNGAVPVRFWSNGARIFVTTDVKVFYVTGSLVLFDHLTIDGQQVAVGANNNLISIESPASDIGVLSCRLLNARCDAVHITGPSTTRVMVFNCYISRPAIHCIYAANGVNDVAFLNNWCVEAGYGNANTAAGKGIGVQGISALCQDVRIIGNKITDPNQIAIECFGSSGNAPGVQGVVCVGNIIRSSKGANGNRFGISMDATVDFTCMANVVYGTELAFEVAGGCKRGSYAGNVSDACLGDGVQLSNNSGNAANDPDDISIVNTNVRSCGGKGIEAIAFKQLTCALNTVDTAADRGIFINNPGAGSLLILRDNTVRSCVKTGIYLFTQQTVNWLVAGNRAFGNNTGASVGSEGVGLYVNADSQAHQCSITFDDNSGELDASFPIDARTANLALAASVTTSLGLPWYYRLGERWEVIYRIPVQVTGGVAGIKFSTAALPAGLVGRLRIVGNVGSTSAFDSDQSTTPTVTTTTAFMTASFTGWIEVTLMVDSGTADGVIDLQFVTGAAAAGNILKGASMHRRRVG